MRTPSLHLRLDSCVVLSWPRHRGVVVASLVISSTYIRSTFGRRRPAPAAGTEIAWIGQQLRSHTPGEEVLAMRAVNLYVLGVPVFLIVILWLFGVV